MMARKARPKRRPVVLPEPDVPALQAALQARMDRIRAEGARQAMTMADRAIRKRSAAARRGWETRRRRIEETLSKVEYIAEVLRATAAGLRTWQRNGQDGGPGAGKAGVHPMHAANRLDNLAEQLSSSKRRK